MRSPETWGAARDDAELDRFAALDGPEQLVVWGCRTWVVAMREGRCPVAVLRPTFLRAGVEDATLSLDALLRVTARMAVRRFEVRCRRCPQLSADELRLVAAAAAAQQGDLPATRARLGAWLDAEGVGFALPPIRGLATLFFRAGLVLPQRDAVDAVLAMAAHAGAAQSCTLH
ncbi:hypothetical protein PQJ75_19555 [Rhodoplanes sp. TEM]|uniref:Uncharacterized protein n=1 Tax=Rhodoplanes tepidamans TaxID=200616 RepID=A0ABT5JD96_RHOTP|nr:MULTISPECIES: hypothetical protein [Rhodoplanes]MDC7787665.1 hypothetical protein [Rhodoplanes tepidamans]MDC7985933.1 hypothetical protein [Rhodoplanes sp. TEM]MDQ0355235.1 hypothetical protein [Rhodoplanes tepidamans]